MGLSQWSFEFSLNPFNNELNQLANKLIDSNRDT